MTEKALSEQMDYHGGPLHVSGGWADPSTSCARAHHGGCLPGLKAGWA